MFDGQTVAAVIPAFNEERHIATVIRNCPPIVDYLIVVDDHSSDATSRRVEAVADTRVILIRHQANRGVGAAIASGYYSALTLRVGVVVIMAGDDQMDPAYLPRLLGPICSGAADFTKGNRFYSWASLRHMPPLRVLGTVVLTWATRVATGLWRLKDAQNGYVAVASSMLERIDLSALDRGYAVENAMLIQVARLHGRVQDIPIPARYGAEVSRLHIWRDGIAIMMLLLRSTMARLEAPRDR